MSSALMLANWPLAAGLVLAVLLLGWLLLRRRRPAIRERHRAPDALDQGAAPALRNRALIDAPQAAGQFGPVGSRGADDAVPSELLRIKGLGPKLAVRLNELGVTRLDQIAGWTPADVARIDAELGAFSGRPARDGWVEQARLLAGDDIAAYEARFGKV